MAGGSPGYLSSLIEYYDGYGNEALRRWADAMTDIKEGGYEPKKLVSDVLYFWGYGLMGLWPPFVATKPFSTPIVAVKIRMGGDTAENTIKLKAAGALDPAVSDLKTGDGSIIPAGQAKATPIDGRTKLKVELTGLMGLQQQLKVGQTYHGEVSLDGNVIAFVDAPVLPGNAP